MSVSRVDAFSTAAAEHSTVHQVSAAEATDRIDELTTDPAIGIPLGIDGVSLPDRVEEKITSGALTAAKTGITSVEFGIAASGTVSIPSTAAGTEPVSLFGERHIAVLPASHIVTTVRDAFDQIDETMTGGGVTSRVLATGPSSTADMGELEIGVHGPATVHVVVVTDR